MRCLKPIFLCLSLWWFTQAYGQNAAITGMVLDENNQPLANVHIRTDNRGTFSDTSGFYLLQIVADKANTITYSHLGHQDVVLKDLILTTNETYEFNPVLKVGALQVDGVEVSPTGGKETEGITTLSPQMVRRIPGANPGVENILKLLPGVVSNNELSTQYSVRGGNYDENLVYINDIEVYRPFLVRSGQEEGLSFVNSGMVEQLKFSSGGFQARYGDKLSSVLDISYKTPSDFGLSLEATLLGASATLESVSADRKFSTITGLRYRDNGLLVKSQQTRSNFNPMFADAQTYLSYRFTGKFHLNFLGNLSLNDYENQPLTRQTNFGVLGDPKSLLVFYEGKENHTYITALGAVKADYFPGQNVTLNFIASLFQTREEEYSDIIASYEIGSVNTDPGSADPGSATATRGIGSQFDRRRNDLDALISNVAHQGRWTSDGREVRWGIKYTREDIRDRLNESEFVDSAGFFLRPPRDEFLNNQPEEPFSAPIVPYEGVNAQNFVQTNRYSGFVQYSSHELWENENVYYNFGVRMQRWTVSGEGISRKSHVIASPRAQFAIKPAWKRDMLFRISSGLYQQPPFYREFRDADGRIRPEVDAQSAWHVVLGNEFSFTLWERPFHLHSEAYHKIITRVNPYTLEDVRIRYEARNDARAYAYGFDFRMNGAFVPGTESWISLGYLKTQENRSRRGYISRPTDQRLKVGILFQDYIPTLPKLRMYLNLVYNTGVPGGSPSYADPYVFQNRLNDYKRADLGISHIFVDINNQYPNNHWLNGFRELIAGIEIFNLFNTQNSITNTWVRDVESRQQFAVPNYMTSRVLNLKLQMRF